MSRMQNVLNVVFTVVISALLFAVIEYEAAQHMIPSLSTPQSSILEEREYQHFLKPSLSTITNGEFQDAFSRFVADDFPLRDAIIISNATLQRDFIELADMPFGFKVYPTFFGSDFLYSSASERVFKMPMLQTSDLAASIDAAVTTWSAFFEKYPDINWYVYMPDIAHISLSNPGHALVTNPADRTYWETNFFSKLPESCTYIDGTFESVSEWETSFFKTDHHWQIQGALSAYQTITEQLGVTPIEHEEPYETDSGEFWGSYSRMGLCFAGDYDTVWDISYNPSVLDICINGENADATALDEGFYRPEKPYQSQSKFLSIYHEWFHWDHSFIKIKNKYAKTDKTLLIIGDSFTNNIERLFAENYQNVYVLDPRYYSVFPVDINQLISETQPDNALVILSVYWNDNRFLEAIQ